MARALTDEAWAEICEIGLRHRAHLLPDPDARAELETILFEQYPIYAYDRERVAADLRRAEAMVEHLKALVVLYGEPKPRPNAVTLVRGLDSRIKSRPDDMHLRDLYFLEMLHRRAHAQVFTCLAKQRANVEPERRKDTSRKRRKDMPGKRRKRRRYGQREWLVSRLCGIWLNWFSTSDGRHLGPEKLTVTIPPSGDEPPRGPLIEFLTAAMRLVMDVVPDAEALKYAIERDREQRENPRKLVKRLPPGGWKRKERTR